MAGSGLQTFRVRGDVQILPFGTETLTVSCPGGTVVTGGGYAGFRTNAEVSLQTFQFGAPNRKIGTEPDIGPHGKVGESRRG